MLLGHSVHIVVYRCITLLSANRTLCNYVKQEGNKKMSSVEMFKQHGGAAQESAKETWVLTKTRDDRWRGWWYQYSCPVCGWTTKVMPTEQTACPECNANLQLENH